MGSVANDSSQSSADEACSVGAHKCAKKVPVRALGRARGEKGDEKGTGKGVKKVDGKAPK